MNCVDGVKQYCRNSWRNGGYQNEAECTFMELQYQCNGTPQGGSGSAMWQKTALWAGLLGVGLLVGLFIHSQKTKSK